MGDAPLLTLRFEAEIIHWRGPSPFHFVRLPEERAEDVRALTRTVSYGWGMIPVMAAIGDVDFHTSLFARDGTYYLPLKDAVRHAADIVVGDTVAIRMEIRPPKRR